MDLSLIRHRVLPHYGFVPGDVSILIEPLGSGLIHQTLLISRGPQRWVLQRVNPIISPAVHNNICAVTRHLSARGVLTPELVSTVDGSPYVELEGDAGVWRMLTYIDGVAFDVVQSPAQAFAAGALVARFHHALDDLEHGFVGLRPGAHDTAMHLARLREALLTHTEHRLYQPVQTLAVTLLSAAEALPPLPLLPDRVCHGDLKLNNVLFVGAESPASEQARCLVDLDTVGPGALAYELGDAWRSWCNRSGEGAAEAVLDLEVFEASLAGYRDGLRRPLSPDERRALLLGPEWVSLELAARFAADALCETYFGWDAERFPGRGEHNLLRARGQWSLHNAFVTTRNARSASLDVA